MYALRSLLEALRTAVVDLLRRPLFSLLSLAAMTAAIVALTSFLLASRGAREMFGRLSDQAAVEVFLRPDAPPAAIDDLVAQLTRHPAARRVEKVSSEQALAEFKKLHPDLADIRELLGENPLPPSVRVAPRTPDAQVMSSLVRLARTHPAALSVRYDREWLESLARLGEALRVAALGGALVLLFAALVTVGAVIRLSLDDKLDEVALLRLVGAPIHYTLAPVLIGGGALGGAGAVAALLLIAFGRSALLGWAGATPLGLALTATLGPPPSFGLVTVLVAASVVAGAASAGLAAGKTALR